MSAFDLGIEDGMTKVALAKAFGGLSSLAPSTSNVIKTTVQRSRGQIRSTQRNITKPPKSAQAKPKDVRTTAPQPPQIEPSTLTPTQAPPPPQIKTSALKKKRGKKRDRTTGGEPPTGGEPQRPGEDMSMKEPQPGNDPVTYTNGKPHDF